jgi:hypothetical protein
MLKKDVIYCGKGATIFCDGRCNKAWGIQIRPRLYLDKNGAPVVKPIRPSRDFDWDNFVYIPDALLGAAPLQPGTWEGGDGKPDPDEPSAEKMNKWCARQCERSELCEVEKTPEPYAGGWNFNDPRVEARVALTNWEDRYRDAIASGMVEGIAAKKYS